MTNNICISCGYDQFKSIALNNEFSQRRNVVRCLKCGLAFIDPMPSIKELDEFYHNIFSLEYRSDKNKSILNYFTSIFSYHMSQLKIKSRKNFIVKNRIGILDKKILEIGSADGKFLYELKKIGGEVYGVEPSGKEAVCSKKNYGIYPIGQKTEDIAEKFCDYFDVVFCYHVLEHLPDPLEESERIKKILKPGGYLIGEVPFTPINIERLDKETNKSLFDNIHIFHFGLGSLGNLFKKTGYDISVIERVELKSILTRLNPGINLHYLHPSFNKNIIIRILALCSAIELMIKCCLFNLSVIDTMRDFTKKDWTGPNDWIRFIVKK